MDTIKYVRQIDDKAYVFIGDTWYLLTGMVKSIETRDGYWVIDVEDIVSGTDNLRTHWLVYNGYTMDAGVICHRDVKDIARNVTTQSRFDASDIIRRSTWAEDNSIAIKIELIYVNTMHEEWLKDTGGKCNVYCTNGEYN